MSQQLYPPCMPPLHMPFMGYPQPPQGLQPPSVQPQQCQQTNFFPTSIPPPGYKHTDSAQEGRTISRQNVEKQKPPIELNNSNPMSVADLVCGTPLQAGCPQDETVVANSVEHTTVIHGRKNTETHTMNRPSQKDLEIIGEHLAHKENNEMDSPKNLEVENCSKNHHKSDLTLAPQEVHQSDTVTKNGPQQKSFLERILPQPDNG